MNCKEITELMVGYLDGELDPMSSQKIEQHLRDCHKCEQAYEAHTALAHAISRNAPYYKAPTDLRQRVQSSLRDAMGAKGGAVLQQKVTCQAHDPARSVVLLCLRYHGTG